MNGWSLYGLTKALSAQGQTASAEATRLRFNTVWQFSDVTLSTSVL
jgi:hypothetical protein